MTPHHSRRPMRHDRAVTLPGDWRARLTLALVGALAAFLVASAPSCDPALPDCPRPPAVAHERCAP